jgi:FADH2 O2-dependent halogenase
MVQKTYVDLLKIISRQPPTREDIKWFTGLIKERIQPFNTAGLMDPTFKNMYRHTAAMI